MSRVTAGLGWRNRDEAICSVSSESVWCILIRIHWLQWAQGGSAAARPGIRVKSSLTGGGLSCRLAWRTVCLDQSTWARTEGWRGRWATAQIDKTNHKSFGVFGVSPLSFYYDCKCRCVPLHWLLQWLLQWMFALLPSKHRRICSQKSGPPQKLTAWARCLLSKIIPSRPIFFFQGSKGT